MKKVAKEPSNSQGEVQEQTDKSSEGEPKELSADVVSKGKLAISMMLKPIILHTVDINVGGDSLIVNAWGKKALTEMLSSQQMSKEEKKLAKANRPPKNPTQDFEESKHIRLIDGKKRDCFPSTGFKKAMVDAGYMLGIPRNFIRSGIRIVGDFVPLEYETCVMREDPVNVGKFPNKTADLRYRPEYQNWTTTLRIKYREDMFTAEQVASLLQNAGFSIGVGEWRPQKDGQFGTFSVISEDSASLKKKAA